MKKQISLLVFILIVSGAIFTVRTSIKPALSIRTAFATTFIPTTITITTADAPVGIKHTLNAQI